ncbi:hypothetical protein [Metabacillus niabensis]|uniref:hypothetical protein n=1 Tax=Metabacillus niabensis TaxID=324854 RepID=UPI0039A25875
MKFKASDFYLATTEDNIELAINIYIKNIPNFTEREICKHVMSLIWDIATFMTDEICPSCQDSNLKISSSIDTKQIYKTCDNCLVTIYHNSFIERPEEMVPATRKPSWYS